MTAPLKTEAAVSDNNSNQDYKPIPKDWIALPFRRWCELAGVSYSHAYAEAAAGLLKITKSGNKSLITRIESERYLNIKNQTAA
jgi:hypothetical protein